MLSQQRLKLKRNHSYFLRNRYSCSKLLQSEMVIDSRDGLTLNDLKVMMKGVFFVFVLSLIFNFIVDYGVVKIIMYGSVFCFAVILTRYFFLSKSKKFYLDMEGFCFPDGERILWKDFEMIKYEENTFRFISQENIIKKKFELDNGEFLISRLIRFKKRSKNIEKAVSKFMLGPRRENKGNYSKY